MKIDQVEMLRTITHFDQAIENVQRLLVARKKGVVVSDLDVKRIASRVHEKIAMIQEMLVIFTEINNVELVRELSAIEDQLMESLRLVYSAANTEICFH